MQLLVSAHVGDDDDDDENGWPGDGDATNRVCVWSGSWP